MSTHKKILLGSGAALSAVALAVSGSVAGYAAAPAHPIVMTGASTSATAPDPSAPHTGTVAGLQTGPHISAADAQSVHAFKVLHNSIRAAQRGRSGSDSGKPYLHNWLGTSFDDTTSMIGSQADQSVNSSIVVNEHFTTLYTPTMYPTGGQAGGVDGSCIEMSTMYHRNKNIVAAWDWCSAITFVAQVKINAAFMKTYTKHGFYTTQIEQTDASTNTWTSYLYNYQTGDWNQFYQQSGNSKTGTGDGWDFYEIYSHWRADGTAYSCADLHGYRVQAKNIMVDLDGSWALADPSNAGHRYDSPLGAFRCPEITYKIITPYNHWKVTG